MHLLYPEIEAVLPEFLAHVTGVAAAAPINLGVREARNESSHANSFPLPTHFLHIAELTVSLCEYFPGHTDAIEQFTAGQSPGPAHIRHERRLWRRPRQDFTCFRCIHILSFDPATPIVAVSTRECASPSHSRHHSASSR